MKILFYSTKAFEKPFLLQANGDAHEIVFTTEPLSAGTAALANGYSCISIFRADEASATVLELLHKAGVKFIAARAPGFDNIDLETAGRMGITVANVPHYSPHAIAEHAVALILAINRKLVIANQQVHQQNFTADNLVGFDLHNKTVGIIGIGQIGSLVAKIMRGFGCKIIAYDVVKSREYNYKYGVEYVELEDLCREADVISVHASLNEQTKNLINAAVLKKMKKGVLLVNTGRGGVINTADLIAYLENGHLGAAGLDVYENEQGLFFADRSGEELKDDLLKKLLGFPNVLITPHQGFATAESLQEIAATTFANINAWAKNGDRVNEVTNLNSLA